MQTYDVVVVGKGNAALCAALAARDQRASVAMLEAANEDESGGNSRFAGGVRRFAYESADDLKQVTEVTDDEIATSDFGTNTREEFFDDLYRLTSYRTDAGSDNPYTRGIAQFVSGLQFDSVPEEVRSRHRRKIREAREKSTAPHPGRGASRRHAGTREAI